MELISWNVNGLRAILGKGFLNYIAEAEPDILCLQETKAQETDVDLEVPGYQVFWNSAEKKGYSGTLCFIRKTLKPLAVFQGMNWLTKDEEHELEGRVLTVEFEKYFVVNVYVPNAQPELARIKYRQAWDKDLLSYCKELEKRNPVILCGDLNVAHNEIDLARPKQNVGCPGFSDEEREGMNNYLDAGFVDTFRNLHPEKIKYSWWSYRAGARPKNIGWRIDYVLVSKSLLSYVKKAEIHNDIMGSDHCPVSIELDLK